MATMTAVGPDAPTLCGDWTTRDLAAHLVVRERRLDASPGIVIKPLAPHTEKIRAQYATRPYAELLELVRTGPPLWSPLKLVDAKANLAEMFVHHEDVRRSGPNWEPRDLGPKWDAALWSPARQLGRMVFRKASCTVVLDAGEGRTVTPRRASGTGEVVLTGTPAELLLYVFGRDAVHVGFDGPESSIAAVKALPRGV
ncbi:hypothetical protein G419_13446 [Rhodococcus triatomae BKS 15-14]|nr:hypothetical protein G419_13446 [Rhodococcus triatomae BKS 15-14]